MMIQDTIQSISIIDIFIICGLFSVFLWAVLMLRSHREVKEEKVWKQVKQ